MFTFKQLSTLVWIFLHFWQEKFTTLNITFNNKIVCYLQVPVMEQFLLRWGDQLGKEGLRLVLPLIESLLTDRLTTVQAAWLLFSLLARSLGPSATLTTFLPSLSALFSEAPATAKHIKLYHRCCKWHLPLFYLLPCSVYAPWAPPYLL
jgi:hypothetical protein